MDFFEDYFKHVGDTESPMIYHRWGALSTLSTMIGREVILPFGHSEIFLNQYILLLGTPGARKNAPISISRKLLQKAGYNRFASERTSKERFFADMVYKLDYDSADGIEDLELLVLEAPSEIYISNGEFLDFIGQGNMDFLTALTTLWDNLPHYKHPKMNGKSIHIHKPTINILGGATVKGLGMAIPHEALGTGILSRLLLIYSEPTSTKITFPDLIIDSSSDQVVETLMKLRRDCKGEITRSKRATNILDKMYKQFPGMDDARFADYCSRRFTHLLKVVILMALSEHRMEITEEDALKANTILHSAERHMSSALGEFGKSRYSDVSNTIIEALNKAHAPISHGEIWKMVAKDLSDSRELGTIMKNLLTSDKAQVLTIGGKQGYMALHKEHKEWDKELLLEDYLTEKERN
ncbi:MAG: hypothetical protein ACD_86C00003G0024 [uncultured bacterium]|nr:MAG: hypothetical protein ACD_86C00003G0024 [uncultured bacterium]